MLVIYNQSLCLIYGIKGPNIVRTNLAVPSLTGAQVPQLAASQVPNWVPNADTDCLNLFSIGSVP